ncbi:MAG: lycopene cyclase domain-containing protein [Nocardioidaceae bacterium]
MRHLSYLGILLGCLVCVAPLAVAVRRSVLGAPARLCLTLLATFVVFTGWDLYAIHAGQWSYARDTTTGLLLPGRLPVEEALFFIVVPFCMVLTFETVNHILRRRGSRADTRGAS